MISSLLFYLCQHQSWFLSATTGLLRRLYSATSSTVSLSMCLPIGSTRTAIQAGSYRWRLDSSPDVLPEVARTGSLPSPASYSPARTLLPLTLPAYNEVQEDKTQANRVGRNSTISRGDPRYSAYLVGIHQPGRKKGGSKTGRARSPP